MNNNNTTEILSRIAAMREQEERSTRCRNYFTLSAKVDEACRKAMADWCVKVVDALALSRETVGIAMSFLDRYISSDKGNSSEALQDKHKFQLAAITSFYIAVKIFEPVSMGVEFLLKLCRGFYTESEIVSMEQDILFSLEWRVSGPTPLDFVRHLLELLPASTKSCSYDVLLLNAQKQMEYASSEVYFSICKPSVVGVGILLSSLNATNVLSISEKQNFLLQISQKSNLDISSADVLDVKQRLLSHSSPCQPFIPSKSSALSHANNNTVSCYSLSGEASSPVCVTQTARQA